MIPDLEVPLHRRLLAEELVDQSMERYLVHLMAPHRDLKNPNRRHHRLLAVKFVRETEHHPPNAYSVDQIEEVFAKVSLYWLVQMTQAETD